MTHPYPQGHVKHKTTHIQAFIILIVVLLCASCRQPSEQELAETELQIADSLYRTHRYEAALAHIDTIHIRYPQQIRIRKQAKLIELRIHIEEEDSTYVRAERALLERTDSFNRLSRGPYLFEKNTKYQREGFYTHRSQSASGIKGRTLLKASVDEMGRLTLQSISWGRTGHTSFKATCEGQEAESSVIAIGSGWHFLSEIGGMRYEKLIYRGEEAQRLTNFLVAQEKPIRITLLDGEKKMGSYLLSRADQQALKEMSRLAESLRRTREAEHQLSVAAKKRSLYENELAAYEKELNESNAASDAEK
jgi:hypothetical protein